jgi:hypothetical protein
MEIVVAGLNETHRTNLTDYVVVCSGIIVYDILAA